MNLARKILNNITVVLEASGLGVAYIYIYVYTYTILLYTLCSRLASWAVSLDLSLRTGNASIHSACLCSKQECYI